MWPAVCECRQLGGSTTCFFLPPPTSCVNEPYVRTHTVSKTRKKYPFFSSIENCWVLSPLHANVLDLISLNITPSRQESGDITCIFSKFLLCGFQKIKQLDLWSQNRTCVPPLPHSCFLYGGLRNQIRINLKLSPLAANHILAFIYPESKKGKNQLVAMVTIVTFISVFSVSEIWYRRKSAAYSNQFICLDEK